MADGVAAVVGVIGALEPSVTLRASIDDAVVIPNAWPFWIADPGGAFE